MFVTMKFKNYVIIEKSKLPDADFDGEIDVVKSSAGLPKGYITNNSGEQMVLIQPPN